MNFIFSSEFLKTYFFILKYAYIHGCGIIMLCKTIYSLNYLGDGLNLANKD